MSRLEEETWKDIQDLEGYYKVSNTGKLKRLSKYVAHNRGINQLIKGKVLSPTIDTSGYLATNIRYKGVSKRFRVHRLVAKSFVPNPDNKPFVNHKDGNKLNNNDWNLEWNTAKENVVHAFKNGLMNTCSGVKHKHSKAIYQIDNNNNVIAEFISIQDAANKLNICRVGISLVCSGKFKQTKGYKFKYKNNESN